MENEGNHAVFNDKWHLTLSLMVGSDREWWGLWLTRRLTYRAQLPCRPVCCWAKQISSVDQVWPKARQFVISGLSKGKSKLVSVNDRLMVFISLLCKYNCALRLAPRGSAVGIGASMNLSHAYVNSNTSNLTSSKLTGIISLVLSFSSL